MAVVASTVEGPEDWWAAAGREPGALRRMLLVSPGPSPRTFERIVATLA